MQGPGRFPCKGLICLALYNLCRKKVLQYTEAMCAPHLCVLLQNAFGSDLSCPWADEARTASAVLLLVQSKAVIAELYGVY